MARKILLMLAAAMIAGSIVTACAPAEPEAPMGEVKTATGEAANQPSNRGEGASVDK